MEVLRNLFRVVFVLAIASCALTAQSSELDNILDKGVIRVGIDITAPPYGMLDDNAQPTGFDVDSAQLLADDLGVKLKVVPVTGPTRVQFLRTSKVDIVMASFSITDERKQVIDFSEPYGAVPVVVGGPKEADVTGPAGLAGKTIAVTRGTTSDMVLTKSTRKVPNVNIVRYPDDSTTNTAIVTGRQHWIVAASSVLPVIREKNPDADVVYKYTAISFPMGVGIQKHKPELKARINKWVEANLANRKLNDIYKHYFGYSLPEEMLK